MNKKIYSAVHVAVAAAVVLAGTSLPAFAQTGVGVGLGVDASVTAAGINAHVGVGTSLNARFKNIVTRADQEIDRRINALNGLSARINAMVKLSQAEKGSLSSDIQTQLGMMTALKAQIAADAAANNTSTLKLDVKTITNSYRIFALVLPQGAIEAASDRVLTVAGIMTDLSAKLSTRISSAQAAGNNVSAATTALADLNAKVSNANTQAQAATTEIASLKPDNGNATVMASNRAALKDAHAKIVASQKDLIAARVDAQTIIKALASFKVSASASSSASTSAQ